MPPKTGASALPNPSSRTLSPIEIKDHPTFSDVTSQVKTFHENQKSSQDYSSQNYMRHYKMGKDSSFYIFHEDIIGREKSHFYQDNEVVFNAAIVNFDVGNPAVSTPYIGGYFYRKNERGEKERVSFLMTEENFKGCNFNVDEIKAKNLLPRSQKTFDEHFALKESGSVDLSDFPDGYDKKVLNFCVRNVEVQGAARGAARSETKRFVAGYSYSSNGDSAIITKEFAGNAYEFCKVLSLRGDFEDSPSVPATARATVAQNAFSLSNPQNKQAFEVLHHKVKFYGGGGSVRLVAGYYYHLNSARTPFLMEKSDYERFIKGGFLSLSEANLLQKPEFSPEQKAYFAEEFQKYFQEFRNHSAKHAKQIKKEVYDVKKSLQFHHHLKGDATTGMFRGRRHNQEVRQERQAFQKSLTNSGEPIPIQLPDESIVYIFEDGGVYRINEKQEYEALNKRQIEEGVFKFFEEQYDFKYEPLIHCNSELPDTQKPFKPPASVATQTQQASAQTHQPSASQLRSVRTAPSGFGLSGVEVHQDCSVSRTDTSRIIITLHEVLKGGFAASLGLRGRGEKMPHSIILEVKNEGRDFSTPQALEKFHREEVTQDLRNCDLPKEKYIKSQLVYKDGASSNYKLDMRYGEDFRPQNLNYYSFGVGGGTSRA